MPIVPVVIQTGDEIAEGKLLPDGTVQLKPKVTVTRNPEGNVVQIVYNHITQRQAEQRRLNVPAGFELTQEKAPAREAEVSMSGNLDFLETDETLRVISKTAYTALAFLISKEHAESEIYSKARVAICGEGNAIAKLFSSELFLQQSPQGPHQHSVVIVGVAKTRSVTAIVRLFGGLCYYVTLSDVYQGADFASSIGLDAMRGQRNLIITSHLDTEFHQLEQIQNSEDTVWSNQIANGRSFLEFIDREITRLVDQGSVHQST